MIITKNKFEKTISQLLSSDNPEIRAITEKYKDQPELLSEILGELIGDLYKEVNPFRWEPVETIKFLEDPYYCGTNPDSDEGVCKEMYDVLKKDFCETHNLDFNYQEIVFNAAIGAGKSFFMSLGLVWHLYFLSCLKSPQAYFQLSQASKIAVMIISITEKQAKNNMFFNVKEMIKKIPYFRENFMFDEKRASESLIFPNNIELFCGTSSPSSTIGLNIFAAGLDEANFFKTIESSKRAKDSSGQYNEALVLYNSLLQRQESRFLKKGLKPGILYLGSSKVYPNDFTAQRIKSAKEEEVLRTYIMEYARWEVSPEKYSTETFSVELGGMNRRNRILSGLETDVIGDIVKVPIDFKPSFQRDIDSALRDIANIALFSVQPFFGQREKIHEMFDESLPRIFSVDRATLSPKKEYLHSEKILSHTILNPKQVRYVAMDIGIKKDRFGFALGHVEDIIIKEREFWNEINQKYEIIKEKLPLIVADLVLQIYPELEFGEVELSRVRAFIFTLRKFGYKIKYSSADGFQSKDMEQILKRAGINHQYISMDKTTEPYECFREAVYDNRVRCPYNPYLEEEMHSLEMNYVQNMVNHPANSSKDLADAIGQMVYNCHINMAYMDDSLLPVDLSGNNLEEPEEMEYDVIIEQFESWARGIKS